MAKNMIEKKNIEDLTFTRITSPLLFAAIPQYLFEQTKEVDGKMIEVIKENAASIMMIPILSDKGEIVWNQPKQNVWIAVLHDESLKIKGFLWAIINIIERCIFIQGCALDEEYQSGNGDAIKMGIKYLRSLPFPDDIKTNIRMATTKPKAFEKQGFRRSKKIIMEYDNEPETTSKNTMPADDGVGGKTKPEVQ